MDIVGIDLSKAKFDAALLLGERTRHAAFSNTEAGFQQLLAWLAKHRPDPAAPSHACLEATGNWGLDLAAFLHGQGMQVSIVNPARIKAFGESELARNKTDKLDAALIARFCALTSRLPGRHRPRTCANCASSSAAATPSRRRAFRNSTANRPASPRPRSQPPSPPTSPGSTSRSRRSRRRCASSSPLIPRWPATLPWCAASPASARSRPPSCERNSPPSQTSPPRRSPRLPAFRPGAQLRHLRAQARQDEPYRSRAPAQHALHVRAQRQANEYSPRRLRPAHDRRRQAAQGHPDRRRP